MHWLSAACLSLSGVAAGVLILQQPASPTIVAAANAQPQGAATKNAARPKTAVKRSRVVKPKVAAKAKRSPKRRVPSTPSIGYRKVVVAGVSMNVVQIDPKRPGVNLGVATAGNGLGYRDDWSRMIDRTRPTAAITGTYFCTTSSLPVGLIKVRGKTIYRGGIGTALAFSPGKGAIIRTCKPGIGYDWSQYETVLRAGPRLVTNGQRTLFPEAEGFKDPAVFARKPRTAVAITREGKLLFVAVQKPVLLRTLADALRKLGAEDAMCLDGGGSTALYYKGKTLVKPGRPLTNLLVAYDSRSRSRIYAGRLNPDGPRMVKTESNAG
jgi:hypothetical protein